MVIRSRNVWKRVARFGRSAADGGPNRRTPVALLAAVFLLPMPAVTNGAQSNGSPPLKVVADKRLSEPLAGIIKEYQAQFAVQATVKWMEFKALDSQLSARQLTGDAVLALAPDRTTVPAAGRLTSARRVAWKYPSGEAVWGGILSPRDGSQQQARAKSFLDFAGGKIGHRFWSKAKSGFTIVAGGNHAESFNWVAENRVKETYPATAERMIRECGSPRGAVCIDIGCGPGHLDLQLAKRTDWTLIGLDIDADNGPLFEQNMSKAGVAHRARFVAGDAQDLPFEDNFADVIVSRGTLTFIPDLAKCLREVRRVLKPTGVAFMGGRYLYTPGPDRISDEQMKKAIRDSGVKDAQFIGWRGQWVKIAGPESSASARSSVQGPGMLVHRIMADYGQWQGTCVVVCGNDSASAQQLLAGFLDRTTTPIAALYSEERDCRSARKRYATREPQPTCLQGDLQKIPLPDDSVARLVGAGPMLIWGPRQQKMREIYRVLQPGGVALVGGRFLGMPAGRRVASQTLLDDARAAGITTVRVLEERGQWVEVRKPPALHIDSDDANDH